MKDISINLLKTQQSLTPYELSGLRRLKIVSTLVLVLLLTAGSIVGIAFLLVTQRFNSLETEKSITTRKITLASRKEVLLLAIKERVPVTQRTIKSQYPWNTMMNAVRAIATPPLLVGIRMEENNTMHLDLKTTSLDEINTVIQSINQFVIDGIISKPIINSLIVDNEGIVKSSVQFTPVQ